MRLSLSTVTKYKVSGSISPLAAPCMNTMNSFAAKIVKF